MIRCVLVSHRAMLGHNSEVTSLSASNGRSLVGSVLDRSLAIVAILGLMIACAVVWATARGLQPGFATL